MAVYFATKASLMHLSEAVAEEVAGSGVTAFSPEAKMEETRLFGLGTRTAPAVAAAGYRGMRRGAALVLPGAKNQIVPIGAAPAEDPRAQHRRPPQRLSAGPNPNRWTAT